MEMDLGRFGVPTLLSPVTPLTQKRVVEAATNLFLYRPMNEVSVGRIAREARVSRRALYDICDKREKLLKWIFEPLFDTAASYLPLPISHECSVEEALHAHANSVVKMLRSEPHRRLIRALHLNSQDQPWLKEAYDRRIRRPLYEMFKCNILDRCVGTSLDLAASEAVAERFFGLVEAYAANERVLGSSSREEFADADAELREFASWFVRRHFTRPNASAMAA